MLSAPRGQDSLYNMLDGNPETRWTAETPQEPGICFLVDMGAEYTVSGIVLEQGVFWRDWPRGLAVYASVSGQNWEKVYEDSGGMKGYVYDDGNAFCFRNMGNCIMAVFEPVSARLIKVEQTSSDGVYWWSAAGLEILRGQ